MNKKFFLIASLVATISSINIYSADATNSQPKDFLSEGLKALPNPVVIAFMVFTSFLGPQITIGTIILVGAAAHHETLIPMVQNTHKETRKACIRWKNEQFIPWKNEQAVPIVKEFQKTYQEFNWKASTMKHHFGEKN
jgi:hypothetical protein